MDDDALIEKMWDAFWIDDVSDRERMQSILAVARKSILEEAAKAVFSVSLDSVPLLMMQHTASQRDMQIADAIRSLANQEQPK